MPTKLSTTIKKAELNSKQIEDLQDKSNELRGRVQALLKRTEPLRSELSKRFYAINKLQQVLTYLKSFEKIDEIRFVIFKLHI